MTKVKLGYSPCPNDTYIFGGIALGIIDTPLQYEIIHEDIADLNAIGQSGDFDVIKLSYHAWSQMIDQYQMLPLGSALGFGVGPLLIANQDKSIEDIKTIAIPGLLTTANFLLNYAYGSHDFVAVEMLFSEIEGAIREGRVDAGVIIHENRFTYAERGFFRIIDLGSYWESSTQLPIPLGGIAIKRSLDHSLKHQILEDLQASINLADQEFSTIADYVKEHAQEMDVSIMQQHIDLYVNESTRGLSTTDMAAIEYLIAEIAKTDQKQKNNHKKWLFIK